MAKAIAAIEQHVPTPTEVQTAAVGEILAALAVHKDGLLAFLDIVAELHAAGLLQLVQGMLKSRQELGVIGVTQLNKSGAQRTIRNSISAMQLLGQLDPGRLKQVLHALASGLDRAVDGGAPQPSSWEMLKSLREPAVQTSLGTLVNFLRGMGQGLSSEAKT